MGDLEPHQSREMLIENLAMQIPKRPHFFKPTDSRFFLTVADPLGGQKRIEKYRRRQEVLATAKPHDRHLWDMILSESVAQAADVAESIGAERPDFLSLLFTGSNRVGLGDYRDPELDFRLITEDDPWDIIDMFKDRYAKKSKARDIRHWRERLATKLGDPMFSLGIDEKTEPLSASDLILPPDVLDIGWNPQNGALAPILSEGGAFTRKALDGYVLVPNRMTTLKKRRGFDRSMIPVVDNMANLAENQLAFSTPIWIKKGEKDYINGLIKKARQMVIPTSVAV